MRDSYFNSLKSERVVEVPYIIEAISTFKKEDIVLDIGGIVTSVDINRPIFEKIEEIGCDWQICDFRGGTYVGDFCEIEFGEQKFDKIILLSVLEHMENCTEDPNQQFRKNRDKVAFQKAMSLLKDGGELYMTVPVGKPIFVPFHRSYNVQRLRFISEGYNSNLKECLIYKLIGDNWFISNFEQNEETLNPTFINAVGLFKFVK